MTAALNALSLGLRNMLEGLRAEHSDGSFATSNRGFGKNEDAFRAPVSHPVIIRHPETGVPALYVNGDFTTRFDGCDLGQSVGAALRHRRLSRPYPVDA